MVLPPAPPRVVCLGNVVADHVFRVEDIPQPPAKIAARSYALNAGGMAANAAIAVTRLGGRADFWGRVGDDLNAPLLAAALEADGVNTAGLRRMPGGRSPVSAVLVDRHGERTIIGFRGADLGIDPGWLPLETLAGAGALCCDPRWPEGVAAAAAEARRLCIPVVLDGEKSETRILVDLVPRVDHAIFSVTGLQNFAPGTAPEEGLRRALASGPVKLAAVTRGEKGTLWLTPGMAAPKEIPAFKVGATNTTGAGDVFHGAYALAIAEGMGVEAALRFASAAGALRARDGTTPYRPMVEAMLAGV